MNATCAISRSPSPLSFPASPDAERETSSREEASPGTPGTPEEEEHPKPSPHFSSSANRFKEVASSSSEATARMPSSSACAGKEKVTAHPACTGGSGTNP